MSYISDRPFVPPFKVWHEEPEMWDEIIVDGHTNDENLALKIAQKISQKEKVETVYIEDAKGIIWEKD